MVVQQLAQLGPQLVGHRSAGAQRGHKGGVLGQRIAQGQPLQASEAAALVGVALAQAGFGHQAVAGFGVEGGQGAGLHIQRWQQAHLAQQQQLEGPQRSLQHLAVVGCQNFHRHRIGVEQRRVRVVTRQQAQQQFVEVET